MGSGPDGLAFDKSGNLYVANFFDNTVDKITPGGVVSTFINTGLNGPKGLAFDSSGNLFVANFNIGEIAEYNSSGALITAGFNATGFAALPINWSSIRAITFTFTPRPATSTKSRRPAP